MKPLMIDVKLTFNDFAVFQKHKWVQAVNKYKVFRDLNQVMVNELIEVISVYEKDYDNNEQKVNIKWMF